MNVLPECRPQIQVVQCILCPHIDGIDDRPFNLKQLARLLQIRSDKLVAQNSTLQQRLKALVEEQQTGVEAAPPVPVVGSRAAFARRRSRRRTGQFEPYKPHDHEDVETDHSQANEQFVCAQAEHSQNGSLLAS
eukprot:gnl/Spiro4/29802_TR14644_c0_g1_i1.p2 gnl/Spiro4/29802_TR14644_c0_g1~~gnl/Spiro4/29802_TR14644_c0_g1_i1.p2  ORF type:complete len:153 (+),score=18.72 gnl/Spiro4/29802_TR14644_c0_g1_i1:59-460(+)